MTRHDQINVHQPRKTFGHFLNHGARQSRRTRSTRLPGRQQQHRHAGANTHLQCPARIFGKLEWRYHKARRHTYERLFPPAGLATRDGVQHGHGLFQVLGQHPAAAHVLGGAGDARVAGVHVQITRIHHVPCHQRTLVEMHVIETVNQARDVVQIRQGGFTVLTRFRVHHVHRRTGGAEVHLVAGKLHLAPGHLTVEHEIPRRHGDGVFYQGAGEKQPAVSGVLAPGGGHQLDTRGNGIGEPDLI
jgi:hypothetical protein